MRLLLFACLLVSGCTAASSAWKNPPLGSLIAERGVVLPADVAPKLFAQCSRRAPAFSGQLWIPAPTELADLENRFPAFYEANTRARPMSLVYYYRQYAGFIADDGRRLIYASFFIWPVPSAELQKRDPVRYNPDLWKKFPYIICDGGSRYFGVVFDPRTNEFSNLEFNGF